MKVISIMNQKGGVGKTTSTINIAHSMASLGKKVLIIDLDAQANSSSGLGVESNDFSSYEFILKRANLSVANKFNIDIIPASLKLALLEKEIISEIARESFLKKAIEHYKLKSYDYILIDCPPSLSILTLNSLVASNFIVIPIETELFAFEGISQLIDTINAVKEINKNLKILAVFINKYDVRNKTKKKYIEHLEKIFKDKFLKTKIRQSIIISKSQEEKKPLLVYDKNSRPAGDFLKLTKELITRVEQRSLL